MLPRRFFISVCQSLIYFPPQRGQMLEGTDRAVETIGGREGKARTSELYASFGGRTQGNA